MSKHTRPARGLNTKQTRPEAISAVPSVRSTRRTPAKPRLDQNKIPNSRAVARAIDRTTTGLPRSVKKQQEADDRQDDPTNDRCQDEKVFNCLWAGHG